MGAGRYGSGEVVQPDVFDARFQEQSRGDIHRGGSAMAR